MNTYNNIENECLSIKKTFHPYVASKFLHANLVLKILLFY